MVVTTEFFLHTSLFSGHSPNSLKQGQTGTNRLCAGIVYHGDIMTADLPTQIVAELGNLAPDAQQRVLEYVRSLQGLGPGMSVDQLRKHIGSIDPQEGRAMREAIEAGCEQVTLDEW